MLEVNDFNAIRISLASPEQIRSWSYGEVTKPETINYRTLKPERDGLFCEKIFGPTKDWECYCGKYKRVRYKGIVCDKCGVEVARAKVRRERMGHIELSSPVAHIWFVKGTPSRLGLLLDISPRNLERVLYFATYIITGVDDEARQRLTRHMRSDADEKIAEIQNEAKEKTDKINEELNGDVSRLEEAGKTNWQRLEDELSAATDRVMEEAKAVRERLVAQTGQAATEPITFLERVFVEQDEAINADRVAKLTDLVQDELARIEEEIRRQQGNSQALVEAERDQLGFVASQKTGEVNGEADGRIEALRRDAETRVAELHAIEKLQLLSETKFRELHDRYGRVFKAGMGAEAVRELVAGMDLDEMAAQLGADIHTLSGQRRKKATKRLRVVEAFRKSGNRPEWMIFTALPVIPPDLRPMVQLDGGRFATSDLNDLYRRVINRNNRLRRLLELGAPEIIIRNEKRMLQEAVDALIDNGRRGRVVSGSSKHKLKSLSDMLKGKQGRFRQNLLGKRVDYSGRSVIVVGPELKLHQCGLPKKMALELFKPFVMRRLVERGYAHNIKSAKRVVERVRPEVWDVLEEVIKDYLVLLNRAPTLHRLGIQAFEAVLIEGSAIQIHPLVCSAYNADFDGDQMAVHVPLSTAAQGEARSRMLSVYNLLSPSNGEPVVTPTQDIVLGCYYLTALRPGAKGEGKIFSSFEEAELAHSLDLIDLQAPILVQTSKTGEKFELLETSVGRIIFNEVLPKELSFRNDVVDKKALKTMMLECYRSLGPLKTAEAADAIKRLGFQYATKGGLTIAVEDIKIPTTKAQTLSEADGKVEEIERQYRRGLITDDERYRETVEIWTQATEDITRAVEQSLDRRSSIYMMAISGAKGNIQQIRQMAGMRGLMADPSGRIIDLPIRSNFREGLTVLEYFISTHGARKGLADTALRTADSGYLTRRLVDVAQDVIVTMEDCGTEAGIVISDEDREEVGETLGERILGLHAAAPILDPTTDEMIVDRNQEIDEIAVAKMVTAGISEAFVRSPLTCAAVHGVCQHDYGRNLATARLVEIGEAVGIIAAQSIGEPGTQLTMRTFHTGGIAGEDITSGLPRVEELFEARVPKGQAVLAEIDGTAEIIREEDIRKIKIVSSDIYTDEYPLPPHFELMVKEGKDVDEGEVLAKSTIEDDTTEVVAGMAGKMLVEDGKIIVRAEERDEREYVVPHTARLRIENGERVSAGQQLTDGASNPQDILHIMGREAVQRYLVNEVQKVYRSQGVNTNDKHIEIIVRQMLRKVRIDTPGDTELLPGELIDRFAYEDTNARVLAEGGEPATAQSVLLGVTKASLNTDSFLSAASFQETTRVLTEAAITGSIDRLRGLKENVIIGKLIPAGSGIKPKEAEKELVVEEPIGELYLTLPPREAEAEEELESIPEELTS